MAHVPFYDWLQLEGHHVMDLRSGVICTAQRLEVRQLLFKFPLTGLAEKEAYLTELLLRAHSTEFGSLSIDTGKEGHSANLQS